MLSVFCAPSRYVQGRDATLSLGSEMHKLGLTGHVFLMASKSARKNLERVWAKTFRESGSTYSIYDFGGECSRKEIDAAKVEANKCAAKVVVGAGGGKVLDAARAVASELNLPIVNCPTLASSDAPCSALSVVYSPDGEFESYIFYKRNPDLVLVDTTVIALAPPRYLVAGMGDALATWFEAQTVIEAKKKNQLGGATTISAAALAHLCFETLLNDGLTALRSVEARVVTPALERLVEANTLLSGLGFESGGLAIAHSVHNGLTMVPQTHKYMHGEKVAFGLLVQLVAEGKPQLLIDQIIMFCANVGLPICLADVGITSLNEDIVRKISERAAAPGETAHNSPFEVTPRLLADALIAADALGRPIRGSRI
ncbi:MAG TPA: glycerol dehydrogenase [Oculatellaceae cyanobacterium]